MLGEMFDPDQTSPNITKHDVRSPNKVRRNVRSFAQAFKLTFCIIARPPSLVN